MSLLTSGALRIGAVHLKPLDVKEVRGEPMGSKRNPVAGEAQMYQATLQDGHKLDIADVKWETSDRDVRCLKCSQATPQSLQRLRHGLRLGVYNHEDGLWVELSQARLDPDLGEGRSTLCRATMEQLNERAGVSVRRVLEGFGAEVDRREQLLGDTSRRRLYLCATFPADCGHLPAICYVLTRILPLSRGTIIR